MKIPKFKTGDLVTCPYSEEIEQPMEVVGRNTWYTNPDIVLYYIKGKHKKRGNELIITLGEAEITKA